MTPIESIAFKRKVHDLFGGQSISIDWTDEELMVFEDEAEEARIENEWYAILEDREWARFEDELIESELP